MEPQPQKIIPFLKRIGANPERISAVFGAAIAFFALIHTLLQMLNAPPGGSTAPAAPAGQPTDWKTLAAWFGGFVALLGYVTTTYFAQQKNRRETARQAHELEKIQLENQKLRAEIESIKRENGRRRVKRPS
ncbi:hypothetical protein [Paraburkholderia sp. BL17N1]|uniref:hypothetical protein n=1 Tax=Paraburkholderia sp. BL17N1 TaxID=1938798 RepID=UPI000EAC40AF|nr:hypothetical protein [Paraburkholderia sp. BL17N1]RKR45936.1 hypothetical protein B0G82_3601 [Paraburkholderia sp. BL17N1]